MSFILLCFLPRSTHLPSSWICCVWQTRAVTRCTEGFVWHFMRRNTLVMTTLVVKWRALRGLLHSRVFPNSSLWQFRSWAAINQCYLCVPWGLVHNSRKTCFVWPLSYSFKNEWLFCVSFAKTTGLGNLTEVGIGICPRSGIILERSRPYDVSNRTRVHWLWPTGQTHQICSADVFIWLLWCFFFKHWN